MADNNISTKSSSSSEDSGLVADAFDVLPDEETLAFDEDLDIDFSCETFGSLTDETFSDLSFELPEDTEVLDAPHEVQNTSAKLISFDKERARQWRRKRLLNSKHNTAQHTTSSVSGKKLQTLEPLLPLPHRLKPIKSDLKLRNPLEGGEYIKIHKGPMPMKLRALPESFWKEPKSLSTSSLARSNYAVLPPLFSADNHDVDKIRPVTPPDEKGKSPGHSPRHKKKYVIKGEPNPELLLSLFDHLDDNKVDERLVIKRGRPKKKTTDKTPPPPPRDDNNDPCIVDDLADKLFPGLSLSQRTKDKINTPNYAIIKIGRGSRTMEFPAVKAEENFPAILNELVIHM